VSARPKSKSNSRVENLTTAIAALARPCRATILDLGDGRVIVLMADGCPVCTAARERQRQWEAAHAAETPKATTLKPPTLTDEWA
jgi:hypothetical protein